MTRLHLRWPVLARISALLTLVLFGALPALAQTTAGTITGTVTDPQGAVIVGTTITITDTTTKQSRTTTTSSGGQFVLVDIVPGTYDVSATKTGFSTDQILGIVVSVGTQTTANFKMAVGAESTTIDVQASNADLQTLNAATGTVVDPALVESLPAIGRDVATFMEMQPGVTPGGQTAGTTADQTTFQLDGGSNTSDMDGTAIGYTSGNTNSTTGGFLGAGPAGVVPMPQDSIEEFKVSTTGQTADFSASSGSQSQVVTKRGHDHWHGTAYEYYLDNNFNANTWQNNFPNAALATYPASPVTNAIIGGTSYTSKPSYHYSRFGVAAGGAVLPRLLGGKTYLFANYEGFRWPYAVTYERAVPSYAFLQQGQLTFSGNIAGCTYNGATASNSTCSAAQIANADPRTIGGATIGGAPSNMPATLNTFYNTQLPVSPVTNAGNVGNNGATYAGTFDQSCGALSTAYCDGINTVGYKANVNTPQHSNFFVTRIDHDFGDKWHLNASYRYYNLQNLTNNQVDIGGALAGDKMGTPVAVTPRPQQPWFGVVGLTTNVTSALTNDFHFSFLHNFWQWKGAGAPPQIAGAAGAIEPLGESSNTTVFSPYNVNAQNIRTRIWNGKDISLSDTVSWLKGGHFFQFGGSYQRNMDYHQRTDNGASINYTPTYQIGDAGGGGTATYAGSSTVTTPPAAANPCASTPHLGLGCIGANASTNNARLIDTYLGIVTDTQVANTYTNAGGVLTANAPTTPFGAHVTIPFYSIFASDTWHAAKSLTVSYGLNYAIEMPPTESNGNQVQFTDATGNAIHLDQWLANRKSAADGGQIYNPTIAFALLKNTLGGHKYIYEPYYGGVSPRVSLAWNPRFGNKYLGKVFGDGATVIRGGYGRVFGRLNGSPEVLNPLLSPGLVLGTRCQYLQPNGTGTGTCLQSGYTDTTTYRYGIDGISPLTASAPPPGILPQPYKPGVDGPGVSIASPIDPTLRPSDVDTFNLSIQRQLGRKTLIEVGYIGRLIHNDYIYKNPNQIPYNLSRGGQTFESAYVAIETALGCTISSSQCAKSATPTAITPQPFFEAALDPSYCKSSAGATISCTQAVLNKQTSKFRQQSIFGLWQALDNNVAGANGAGFNFVRSLSGTAITPPATNNQAYGTAGQVVTGQSIALPDGYGNYNGVYLTYKVNGWHGLTAQENFTVSKALGLGSFNQYSSSISAEDSYNLRQQYGRQTFDQKVIFNTFLVYSTPWYKDQHGIVGRLAGGWIISPVVQAGTGQPLICTTNNSGQNFGGEDGSTFTDNENCILTSSYNQGHSTHRGIYGGTDSSSGTNINVGTSVHAGTSAAAVNMFQNPTQLYQSTRPPILGIDARDGGTGPISGLGYLNMDLSIRKNVAIWEKASLELSGTFFNVMNHLDFNNPSFNINSAAGFGVTKTQGNTPRQIQMGARVSF